MGEAGWTVQWALLAVAGIGILAVALPLPFRSTERTIWLWLGAVVSVLAAVAGNAYGYRLLAALYLTAMAFLAVHIRGVWPGSSRQPPEA